jgi:hypothetical protein
MDRLNVETRKVQRMATTVLAVICIPLGLLSVFSGLSGGLKVVPLGIGLMMLATYGAVMALNLRGRSMSVKYFSSQGLERNDGRWLSWADLERVVHQTRRVGNDVRLWRTEIRFNRGDVAWLLPMRVANRGAVDDFVRRLPCEHTQVSV